MTGTIQLFTTENALLMYRFIQFWVRIDYRWISCANLL